MDDMKAGSWDARFTAGFEPGMGGVALIPRDDGEGPVRLLTVVLERDRMGLSQADLAERLLSSAREGGLPAGTLMVALPAPSAPYRGRADNVLRLSHALSQATLGRRPSRERSAMVGVREGAKVVGEAMTCCHDRVRGFGLVSGEPSRNGMGPAETAGVLARELLSHDDMLLAMTAATEAHPDGTADSRALARTVETYRELLQRLSLPVAGDADVLTRVAAQEVRSWPPATRTDFTPELAAVIRGLASRGMWG